MIFNHYLTVSQWQPNFDPNQNLLRNLLVWVRMPCLPIEYFDYNFLMRVGSKLGKPVKVDDSTSVVSRGHYARICVEVDLMRPLVSEFRLRRRIRRLEYEGIHLVCFGCGLYGHRKEECPQDLSEEPAPPDHRTKENSDKDPKLETSAKAGIEVDMDNPEVTKNFGPWMLARRRIRKSQNFQNHQESTEVLKKGEEDPKQLVAGNLGAGSNVAVKSKFSILDLEGEENLPRGHDEKGSGPYESIAREEEPKIEEGCTWKER